MSANLNHYGRNAISALVPCLAKETFYDEIRPLYFDKAF